MAKQFYTPEEAQEKLGMSTEELKELVRDGQLREFRDGGSIRFKAEEVDGLAENLSTLSGSLGGTSGELILEPADETSMGLTGSDMLTLEEAEGTDTDDTVVGDQKEDTVITSVGISVFDDEEVQEADPAAKTVLTDKDKGSETDMSVEALSGSGSGSGLLDLTKESDDTSLGAELLDEIYTEDAEAGLPEMGDATRAGLEAAIPEERQPEEIFDRSAGHDALEQPAVMVPRVVVKYTSGPVESGLCAMLLAALVFLGVAGVAVSANMQGAAPALLNPIFDNLPIYGGVGLGITIICYLIGFFIGRRSTR